MVKKIIITDESLHEISDILHSVIIVLNLNSGSQLAIAKGDLTKHQIKSLCEQNSKETSEVACRLMDVMNIIEGFEKADGDDVFHLVSDIRRVD